LTSSKACKPNSNKVFECGGKAEWRKLLDEVKREALEYFKPHPKLDELLTLKYRVVFALWGEFPISASSITLREIVEDLLSLICSDG